MDITPSKHLTTCGWDDVPHIDAQTKAELLASTLPHLRAARSQGTPSQGSGAIYPMLESEFVINPIPIAPHWPRSYGLDVGWNRTAAVWGALDRDQDVLYLYSEHYRAEAEAPIHTAAINARGEWIPGVIDPAARGRSQIDGQNLLAIYRGLGLKLIPADNAVEAGILDTQMRLQEGRLKVFNTMQNWLAEFRDYHREEDKYGVAKVVKEFDHLMDATRYLVRTGLRVATIQPSQRFQAPQGSPVADRTAGY